MADGSSDSSFALYLSTWPRLTAFKRPASREKMRASKSFMIDDILKRDEPAETREQPYQPTHYSCFGTSIWNDGVAASQLPLYQTNFEKFNACTTEARQAAPTVMCPVPKYFRAFLQESQRFRRTRTVFTREQLQEMEERFDREKYLSTNGRNDFARQLKLTPLQVKTWFQNRRMKWKKEMLKKNPNAVTTRAKGRPKKDEF